MTDHEHEGMKKCTKCGEIKPATAEFFSRDRTKKNGLRGYCKECSKECRREYYQKNIDKQRERSREYRQKNRDHRREYNREYKQKNTDRLREYKREYQQSPVGRFSISIGCLRQKTGATIYVRDMTDEQKEALANQYVAVKTLEKTERELLAASGKKRCPACDRILDYGCFNKDTRRSDGVRSWCRECAAEHDRKYRQKNREEIAERQREYNEKNKDKIAERRREYYEKNKDKIKEHGREYYEKNKEKIKERKMAYYKNKKVVDKTQNTGDNVE